MVIIVIFMAAQSILDSFEETASLREKGVRFVEGPGKTERLSYSELIELGKKFSDALLRNGVNPGEPVVLVMTNPKDAIVAILGCMMNSCPPTPIYPPVNIRAVPAFLNFLRHVAERAHATLVVANSQVYPFLGNIPHEVNTIRAVESFDSFLQDASSADVKIRKDQPVAFLQFTSGSTSLPKGVLVTHSGLLSNLEMIRIASRMSGDSCVVTWLPVYHDMGLIGTVLNAISLPCDLVVIPPRSFLKRPRLWLELISEFHGTHTAAPNFAFGLCVKRVEETEGLNLSSMTTFICGAEPVLPRTMEDFVRHYSPAGLKAEAMVPAYGLAEATLAVTFTPYLRGLQVDEVDVDSLSAERFARKGRQNIRVASCGLPLKGLEVRIASEEPASLEERKIGEIQIRGASVTPGYIGDGDATMNSRTVDGWLRTGDLGYISEGELYPCGRIKDMIIIRGRNYHAHDIESAASEVEGIRTGNVVAFCQQKEEGDSLVIVAETRNANQQNSLSKGVKNRIVESMGITPDDVVIVPAGTLPKTSSGKLKRIETRTLYERGELHVKPSQLTALQAAIQSGFGFLKRSR